MMIKMDEAEALTSGNSLLAKLGFPPCADIDALTRESRALSAKYAKVARVVATLEMVVRGVRRPPPYDLRKVRAAIVGQVEKNGPMFSRQIAAALAGEFPENVVGAQIWYLDHHERCIMASPDGWRLRYVSDHADFEALED